MNDKDTNGAEEAKRVIPPDPEPNPSLQDTCSPGPDGKAYNEAKARKEFDDKFVDELKQDQKEFRGDWSHLAQLVDCERKASDQSESDKHPLNESDSWRLASTLGEFIHLENAMLIKRHFEHADMRWVHLEHAELTDAYFEHTDLSYAHLEHAKCLQTHFEYAKLNSTHLEHAKLFMTHLEHAKLSDAHLEHARLFFAHLEHADLSFAHLEDADLRGSNLRQADLRRTTGIRFNDNFARDIRIKGNAPDPWSQLRRKYTGPRFFLHLLLLVVFFAPYAGRLAALSTADRAQEWLASRDLVVRQAIAEHAPHVDREAFISRWHGLWSAAVEHSSEHGEQVMAWWVLIGGTKAWWVALPALVMLIYNLLRLALTLRVGLLRDAEERSGVTPAIEEYLGATMMPMIAGRVKDLRALGHLGRFGLYRLHRFASVLFWFAVASVVINSVLWLATTWVWMPK